MRENDGNIRVLHSESFDPWFNLAAEDWIFRGLKPEGHVLLLWRNSKTVVIGRYQNPWIECRLDKMAEDGVKLARRQSGGGAVYHDLQNLNFTLMSAADLYDKKRNFGIITEGLARLGINAEVSARNDILIEDKKVSGNAFRLKKDRVLHHGTLLVNSELDRLENYLNPEQLELESKGIKSVKSRVANLVEFNSGLTIEALAASITDSFFSRLGAGADTVMDTESLKRIPELSEYFNTMKSRQWLYGRGPDFTHRISRRFEWGNFAMRLEIKKCEITDAEITSDCAYPDLIEKLQGFMSGVQYKRSAVVSLIDRLERINPEWSRYLADIRFVLNDEIRG